MKTLTDQLRALAVAPEFEDTTTAKLFLEIACRAEAIEGDNAKLRAMLNRICPNEYTINTGFSAKEVRALLV